MAGKINLVIAADDQASGSIRRTETALEGLGDKSNRAASTAAKGWDKLTDTLTSRLGPASGAAEGAMGRLGGVVQGMGPMAMGAVGAVAGLAAGIAALAISGVGHFITLAGKVRDFKNQSGLAAEEASRWLSLTDDFGISSETLGKNLFKLEKNISTNGEALGRYGIEVARNKQGLTDVTGTILNVADAYKATFDPAERAALLATAFGKSGAEMVPILERSRKEIKAMYEGVREGEIFSQADLDKALKFEMAVDDMGDAFGQLQRTAGEALVPFLTKLAEGAAKGLDMIDGFFDAVGKADKWLGERIGFLGALQQKEQELKGTQDAGNITYERRLELVQEYTDKLNAAIGTYTAFMSAELGLAQAERNYNEALRENGATFDLNSEKGLKMAQVRNGLIDAVLRTAEATIAESGANWDGARRQEEYIGRLEAAKQKHPELAGAIQTVIDKIRAVPPTATTEIRANSNVPEKAREAADSLNALTSRPWYVQIIEVVQRASDALPFGGAVKAIGRRAHGGPVSAGQVYLVGEEGPELAMFGRSGNIVPNDQLSSGRAIGGGQLTVQVFVSGSVLSEEDLVDAVHAGLLRKQTLGGSLGMNR